MLRLSRTTTGLLAVVALLSALTAWDGCAERQDTSPLDLIGALTAPKRPGDPEREAALRADVMGRSQRLVDVAGEVRAGRLSLLDAAARVRDIQSASPYFPWDHFRRMHPGATDDERFCRMVIELTAPSGGTLRGQDPVVTRLEAELEDHLKNGTLRLPE
jgi:hypothetical protein